MKKILLIALLIGVALPATAEANSNRKVVAPPHEDIAFFCEGKPAPQKKGVQWDGAAADRAVMAFRSGEYVLDGGKGVRLWLFQDGTFFVNLSKATGLSFGSDGDDLIEGRLVGGCTREQLSEVLKKNSILDLALDVVPEDPALREELERGEEVDLIGNDSAVDAPQVVPAPKMPEVETDGAGLPKKIVR